MQRFQCRLLVLGLCAVVAGASAVAQTTVAVSGFGAFSGATSADGTLQSPANAAGGIVEFRQIRNPFVGFEATYSFNRSNQEYKTTSSVPTGFCPPNLSPCTDTVTATAHNIAHEITADWVFSMHFAKLRPFVLAGGGLMLNQPTEAFLTTTVCGTNTSACQPSAPTGAPITPTTKGVFVYGAGFDWSLLPHMGLRFQYRGNLYKASQLITAANSSNAFTHTAEPMVGVYFRF